MSLRSHIVGFISRIQIPSIFPSKSEKFLNSNVPDKIKMSPYYTLIIFKNSGFVMMNSIHLLLINNYSTILTEPEVNNCFSIFTESDLNRIRKETIKKRLVWLTGEFMREHEAVNSGFAKVRSLQYLQTRQMIVLIFLYRVL